MICTVRERLIEGTRNVSDIAYTRRSRTAGFRKIRFMGRKKMWTHAFYCLSVWTALCLIIIWDYAGMSSRVWSSSLTAKVETNVRSRVLTTSMTWMWSPIGMNGNNPWRSPSLVKLSLWKPTNCPIRPLDTLLLWVWFSSYRASVVYWVCGWVCRQ